MPRNINYNYYDSWPGSEHLCPGCDLQFYLRREYELERSEHLLELPLDSNVAKGLLKKRSKLPRWQSIKNLTRCDSAKYQADAAEIARCEGVPSVYLDIWYWRADV